MTDMKAIANHVNGYLRSLLGASTNLCLTDVRLIWTVGRSTIPQFLACHDISNEHRFKRGQRKQQETSFNPTIVTSKERLNVGIQYKLGNVFGKLSIPGFGNLDLLMEIMITYWVKSMSRSQQVDR